MISRFRFLPLLLAVCFSTASQAADHLVYKGKKGPGEGKQLVFIASDHEYRSEQTMPALARILAKHHGFTCHVLFGIDGEGNMSPGTSDIPGLEVLESADLAVFFTRFQNLPDEQMAHIDAYLNRGGPVVGLRTSTHGFKIPRDRKYAKYDFAYKGEEYLGGFGEQVLGETWVGHYGRNHVQSTRLDIVPENKEHPILRGVDQAWAACGGYSAEPGEECTVLAMAQPLQTMEPNGPADESKKPVPGAWVRSYKGESGVSGRVFTTTYGASEDLLDEGFRRMLTNACFWAVGMGNVIEPKLNVTFVGSYLPTKFGLEKALKGIKPLDLSGWSTPIMPVGEPANSPTKASLAPTQAKRKVDRH